MSRMMDDKENQSVLNSFDFTAIDEMDPSLGIEFFLNEN
jgi:hypothetical protein